MTRPPSPAMIRRQGAAAVRNRVRFGPPEMLPILRKPEDGETPLSEREVAFGVSQGLIRVVRNSLAIPRQIGASEGRRA